jgi:hypothetical protein
MIPIGLMSQTHELSVGLRFQKAVHLYWENGFSADYTNSQLHSNQIHIGFNYYTSRWGTAWHSNAIKQDNYLIYGAFHFRKEKVWQPLLKLNTGYFVSDMEYAIFEVLPHQSALLSLEGGLCVKPTQHPLKINASIGYNFITGNGVSGPGTLYPLFYQLTLLYEFKF